MPMGVHLFVSFIGVICVLVNGVVTPAPPVGVVDLAPPAGVVDLAPPAGVVDLASSVGVVGS